MTIGERKRNRWAARLILLVGGCTFTLCGNPLDATVSGRGSTNSPSTVLTNVFQLQRFASQQHNGGCSFRLTGVIRAVNRSRGILVLQDDSGTAAIQLELPREPIERGQRIRLDGNGCSVIETDSSLLMLQRLAGTSNGLPGGSEESSEEHFRSIGGSRLVVEAIPPRLEPTNSATLAVSGSLAAAPNSGETKEGYWSELEGIVTFISEQPSGLELEVKSGNDRMRVVVVDDSGLLPSLLLNGRVHAAGVCLNAYAGDGKNVPSKLIAVDKRDVQILEVFPALWHAYPSVAINELMRTNYEGAARHTVHAAGRIRSVTPGKSLVVEDQTGCIEVDASDRSITVAGGRVEVLGEWRRLGTNVVLECAVCRLEPESLAGQAVPLSTLKTVDEIKRLKRDEAARGHPVSVQGVITCARPDFHSVVLQDATRGIYVLLSPNDSALPQLGEYWAIEGVAYPGDFAPNIRTRRATRMGEGRLPDPLHPTWDQLINGSLDTQYVEVEGVITDVLTNRITLLTRNGKINVELPDMPSGAALPYSDALIRIRGCLFPGWDGETHQVKVGEVLIYNASIVAEEPTPVDPFAAPTKSVAELRLFDPQANVLQRTKVSGQIVHKMTGEYRLLAGTTGLRVLTQRRRGFRVGDLVEVAGFPDISGPSPVLQEADIRKTGWAALPEAVKLQDNDLVDEIHDSTLVRVDALLVSSRHERVAEVLELQVGPRLFLARLNSIGDWVRSIPVGSRLELTGVYAAQGGNRALGQKISSFELLLNYSSDIKVLARPSWWTLRHVLVLLATSVVVLLIGILWVITLGRRVSAQTEIIRQQVQRQATLEERTRLARDFHDTLEQALVAIGIQLNTLAGMMSGVSAEAVRILSTARSMVRHGQEEARRSVRNLRTPALDQGDLPGALGSMVEEVRGIWSGDISVCVSGTPRRLPMRIENNLLRICQEGMSNAMKYATATTIRFALEFTADALRVSIIDDGCGFNPEGATVSAAGHFGLLGMRERAEKIGGTLLIQSKPGQEQEYISPFLLKRAGQRFNSLMKRKIRILIVDDHFLVRIGLQTSIGTSGDMCVVREAGTGTQAVELYRQEQPDVVLMDVRLPDISGIEATARICHEYPEAKVIMISTYDGEVDIHQAFQAGARGYLLKDVLGEELFKAIRTVQEGRRYVTQEIARRLSEHTPDSDLTERELQVLHMLAKGLTNREIGDVLGFTGNTAKYHIKNILLKLGASDRTEAATAAFQRGILH